MGLTTAIPVNDQGDMAIPQSAPVSIAASGELIAGVAGQKIRVIALAVSAAGGANDITFQTDDGVSPVALTGAMGLAADGTLVLGENPYGWFETESGDDLRLNLGAATLVAGVIVYVRFPA